MANGYNGKKAMPYAVRAMMENHSESERPVIGIYADGNKRFVVYKDGVHRSGLSYGKVEEEIEPLQLRPVLVIGRNVHRDLRRQLKAFASNIHLPDASNHR